MLMHVLVCVHTNLDNCQCLNFTCLVCLLYVQSHACVCVRECRSCHCIAAAGLGASAAVVVDVDANADLYVCMYICNKRGACKTQGKSFYVTDLKFLLITPHECEGGNGRESFSLNAGKLHTYICINVSIMRYVLLCKLRQRLFVFVCMYTCVKADKVYLAYITHHRPYKHTYLTYPFACRSLK